MSYYGGQGQGQGRGRGGAALERETDGATHHESYTVEQRRAAWIEYYERNGQPDKAAELRAGAATSASSSAMMSSRNSLDIEQRKAAAWADYYRRQAAMARIPAPGPPGVGPSPGLGPPGVENYRRAPSAYSRPQTVYYAGRGFSSAHSAPRIDGGVAQPSTRAASAGRGRAMVQPAWMKNRSAVSAPGPLPQPVRIVARSSPPSKKKANGSSIEWPPSLRAYVEAAFGVHMDKETKEKVQSMMKQMIQVAVEEGRLHTYDWSKEPPPLEKLRENKMQREKCTSKSKKRSRSSPSHADDFLTAAERNARSKRARRFENDHKRRPFRRNVPAHEYGVKYDIADPNSFLIKGTCQDLEKEYLRLTSAPDPATVRPKEVLVKSLEMIQEKWAAKSKKYLWCCEQMKSIRQDLTVQRIVDDFTCRVYECHARIALESSDVNEYNQCQTQLFELYKLGIGTHESREEFTAYRILHQMYTTAKYGETTCDMITLLKVLDKRVRDSRAVKHAIEVRSALTCGNYVHFFALYGSCPNMGKRLLDLVLDFVRHGAILRIGKAFRPSVPLNRLKKLLLFDGSGEDDGLHSEKAWTELRASILDAATAVSEKDGEARVDCKKLMSACGTFVWAALDGDNIAHLEDTDSYFAS